MTDLGLESPIYTNSCPFVSIRGSNRPTAIIHVNPWRKETSVAPHLPALPQNSLENTPQIAGILDRGKPIGIKY
ncbi:MAG: hypothetical protein ACK5TX_07865, partial [Planctomyces sp.]